MEEKPSRLNWSKVDRLVEEILKDRPNETRVRDFMTDVGMSYEANPVIRLGLVLDMLNESDKVTKPRRRENESGL